MNLAGLRWLEKLVTAVSTPLVDSSLEYVQKSFFVLESLALTTI